MVIFPPCKVNLGLSILARRPDGYHDIETCFYPIPWTDIVEVIPSTQFNFTTSGTPIPGQPEENLCVKAFELMKNEYSIPNVRIHLHKILPMGAGLGGGSSNAAAVLCAVDIIFELKLGKEKLRRHASDLGSDCAFFIEPTPSLATGRGEILSSAPLSLKNKFILIVNPGISISTKEAYSSITPSGHGGILSEVLQRPPAEWKDLLKNDFEPSVFTRNSSLAKIKETMYRSGAFYASMSGSGSSIFGLFENPISLPSEFRNGITWFGQLTQ